MKISEIIKELAEQITLQGDIELPDDFQISIKNGNLTIN